MRGWEWELGRGPIFVAVGGFLPGVEKGVVFLQLQQLH